MAVTGPGLDDAETEKGRHQGDAVILQIASDKKSVILSQVVNTASTNAPFTFLPPTSNPLLWTPTAEGEPGYPLIGDKFEFSDEKPWQDPYEFSQQVYLIMASMNQIGHPNNDSVSKYMQDIVGANMGFIFTEDAKQSFDGKMVTSMIRDMIKSVLRGVSDFTKYPDKIENDEHVVWYPNPSLKRGKQDFNVFNLDPFVWFVHVKLGFSGYGFSVDDDTADVGAGGASQLQLTVTETGGLNNTNPWTIQAPYGPVKNVSLPYSGPANGPDRGEYPLQRHRERQRYHTDQDHHEGSTQPLQRSHRADRPGRRRPRRQWHLQDRPCLAVDVRPVRCRHGHDSGFTDRHLQKRGSVELSAPSLRRLRRRPDKGFLPGDGGRCLGHLPRDARLRERRGS